MDKQKLLNLIKTKALQKGKFILSSGKESDFYIDLRVVTTDAEGAYLIGKILYQNLKNLDFDFIGGMTLGADPIVTSYALVSYLQGNPKSAFIIRKEQKEHGTRKIIEGNFRENSKVVIVDDVVTTGESILRAIREVEKYNCKVVKAIAIVDREEDKDERLKNYGFESIFKIKEILK